MSQHEQALAGQAEIAKGHCLSLPYNSDITWKVFSFPVCHFLFLNTFSYPSIIFNIFTFPNLCLLLENE